MRVRAQGPCQGSPDRSRSANLSKGALCLGTMEPAVPGLEAEEQFERFRAPLCMDPNSAARRDRSPPPQNHVGSSKHAEVVEKRGRIVLGMIEAGGWRYFPTFFRRCSDLLGDGGAMLLQAIVIEEQRCQVPERELGRHAGAQLRVRVEPGAHRGAADRQLAQVGQGGVQVAHRRFLGDRARIRAFTAQMALDTLRRRLIGKP